VLVLGWERTYLDKLFDVFGVSISLLLVDYEDKSADCCHVMAPQMRMFSVQVPHLESALVCHLKLEVVEGLGEEYFVDWLEQAAVGRFSCTLHSDYHDFVDALLSTHSLLLYILLLR